MGLYYAHGAIHALLSDRTVTVLQSTNLGIGRAHVKLVTLNPPAA